MVLKLVCVCHSGVPFGLDQSIHAAVLQERMQTNRDIRSASSEGCCTTTSRSQFCHVLVVVTTFGGRWQQLLLPFLGQGLPTSWEMLGGAQLLLKHHAEHSNCISLSRGSPRGPGLVVQEQKWCHVAQLDHQPGTAAAGVVAGSSSRHAAFLQLCNSLL